MSEPIYILSIDQGTTSSRGIVFDTHGKIVYVAQQEFRQYYPNDGWVEHDPEVIWSSTITSVKKCLEFMDSRGDKISAIGITNQRETTLVWDRNSGKPIYNAIVWQDRRTAEHCNQLKHDHSESWLQQKSGLLFDPYFSASKIAWILDEVPDARRRAEKGELLCGTVDTFLIWRLTKGDRFVTDITNASRTNLFNINTQEWDDELTTLFNVPNNMLAQVLECTADFGLTHADITGESIPILGVAGDQQAATVGQCCFVPGDVKSTYGTGCFMVINTGDQPVISDNRLLTTVGYKIRGKTHYAIEGSIFIAGAAVQWLRDNLGVIEHASDTEALAELEPTNDGVYFVPALTGLGAPHWRPDARGAITGISRATTPAHFARAALESVCYQTMDIVEALKKDGISAKKIRVDGGMVANNWLNQFLADVINVEVERPQVLETTALGAAYLAGLQLGCFRNLEELAGQWQKDRVFNPDMDSTTRDINVKGWQKALERVLL